MRHNNTNYNKLANNNNGTPVRHHQHNLHHHQQQGNANDNAFNYYSNNGGSTTWKNNSSPAKQALLPRQKYNVPSTSYQSAAAVITVKTQHYPQPHQQQHQQQHHQQQQQHKHQQQKQQQHQHHHQRYEQNQNQQYPDEYSYSTSYASYHIPPRTMGGATYSQSNTPSPEPTWDAILSERPPPSTDQHYTHYFSYFYNRGPVKTANATGRRQLPMNFVKNASSSGRNTQSADGQPQTTTAATAATTNHVMVNGRREDPTNNDNRNRNWNRNGQQQQQQQPLYVQQVLKEKLPNNNLHTVWLNDANADADDDDDNDDYNERDLIKLTDPYELKDVYDDVELNERQYRRRVDGGHGGHGGNVGAGDATPNNNNETMQWYKKPPPPPQVLPHLPLTPKRIKGGTGAGSGGGAAANGTTSKKLLPTVHRVLLYNNNPSPRMPRKQQTSANARKHSKSTTKDGPVTVILVEPPDDVKESIENHQKTTPPIDFERDDDFDDDDDLDNLSNFDESDTDSVSSNSEDGYRAHAYKLAHSVDRFISPHGTPSMSSQSSEDDLKNPDSLLVPSLFPFVPPYLSFSSNLKKGPKVPAELHRVLKWRVTNIMPKVVRLILANSGMRMLKKTNDWMGVWGKHLKSPCFKTIRSYQKINHLPGSFRIGRKDSCWKNLQRQMTKHSNREFGFMPRTYIIPNDLCALRRHWPKYAQRNTKWIIKPPASARGAGIRVINRWGQIPKRRPLIVQKYIERPLLINGSKFDLRLYVLVTSVNPLRVFLYHNGLARFASVKYSAKADTLNDRCMHLTNYSINKFSSNYSKNEDVNACHGHKWTIKSLLAYLANRGVRVDCLWEALRALVLRTILAGENGINNMIRSNVESKYSCFELFGFDVILDSDLIPWLLEVNISPSLHSELPLDAHVKAPLVQGVLNTALYNVPPKLTQDKQKELAAEFSFPPGTQICYDKRLYINYLSREEKIKHNTFTRKSMENREEYIDSILQKLTPDDVRCLIVAEDELARCAPLERIFPTDQTHKYLKYNDTPRYYNRLLDAWESRYANNRTEGIALLRELCQSKYHLQVPSPPAKKYIEGDHTAYSIHLQPEQEFTATTGLLHQVNEVDFKVIIAAIVFVIFASLVFSAIILVLITSVYI